MSEKQVNWKFLGVLKFIIAGILILVGLIGELEALKKLSKMVIHPQISAFFISYQMLWVIGNLALLIIGTLYIQQGRILFKPFYTETDSKKINKSITGSNLTVIILILVAITILTMAYISLREYFEILNPS